MIKILLKQLWSERTQNVWIFLELLLVSVFLWIVLNPMCVQLGNKSIPSGLDTNGTYTLNMEQLSSRHPAFNKAYAENDSLKRESYMNIARAVKNLPEVECFSLNMWGSTPNRQSVALCMLKTDEEDSNNKTISAFEYISNLSEGSNYFEIFKIKDVRTGETMRMIEENDVNDKVYISESAAVLLYGTTDVVGKTIVYGTPRIIAGVLEDFKQRDYNQPYPVLVQFMPEFFGYDFQVLFRLKEGVDAKQFEKHFIEEVMPKMKSGNFYVTGITSFDEMGRILAEDMGEYNKMRLNGTFTFFALVCTFLGIVGTFWVRTNTRRPDIGIMRSIGASRWQIMKHFCNESVLLFTIAFVVGIIGLAYYVRMNGLWSDKLGLFHFSENFVPNVKYWQNDTVKTFAVVSVVTYLFMLVTVLIGTFIPVRRAIDEHPADALREE